MGILLFSVIVIYGKRRTLLLDTQNLRKHYGSVKTHGYCHAQKMRICNQPFSTFVFFLKANKIAAGND